MDHRRKKRSQCEREPRKTKYILTSIHGCSALNVVYRVQVIRHNDTRLEPWLLVWDPCLNSGTRLCWLMWRFSQRTQSWWMALWTLWACFWTWVPKTWAIFSSQSATPTPVPRLCTNTGGLLRTTWWTLKRSTSHRQLLSTSASQMSRMGLTSVGVFKHACLLPLTSTQQLGPLHKLWDRPSLSECEIWSGSMLTQGRVLQHEQNSFSVAEVTANRF